MLKKKILSFGYAMKGIRIAYQEESNFRTHAILGACAILLGLYLRISPLEWLFIIGISGLVFSAELLNTALEELCDMLQPSHDPHVAKIKDLAAAAVFVAAISALLVGAIIFIPHIQQLW
jgi:diacylglycerol kinase